MATTGLHFWSTTAATNATADSSVNWAEGQAPSSVNDSARALMASAAKTYKDIAGTLTTGGSSTAYTLTTNQVFASASDMSGAMITFIPHTSSGAAPTLAVDGLTARQIRTAPGTNVALGGLLAGAPYTVTYVHGSTEFILHNAIGVFGDIAVSSLGVNGPLTVSTTLGVTGAATFGSSLTVSGLVTGGSFGTLNSSGAISGTTVTATGAVSGATAAGAMLASQAEQETGTSTSKVVQPGVQHFHKSAAKAWGTFATDGTVAQGYNVSGVVKNSVGDWTVTFTTALSAATYAVQVQTVDDTNRTFLFVPSRATGSFTIKAVDVNNSDFDPANISFVVFGDI